MTAQQVLLTVLIGHDARQQMLGDADILARVVKSPLGPKGSNVILEANAEHDKQCITIEIVRKAPQNAAAPDCRNCW